jgi:Cof subfamily protein (haloacid dehalogenase superfamily)
MLYVSDLDGTLLNTKGELGETSRRLLSGMLSAELRFTVASARSVWSIRQMLDGLKITVPVIEFNGAFISDMNTGEHIAVNAMNEAVKHGVYLEIQAAGFLPFISTFDGEKDNLYHSKIVNEGMRWYYDDRVSTRDPRLRPPRALEGILDEQVVCFTVIDREERLKPLAERLESLYGEFIRLHLLRHFYSEGWHWLTVHDARACKSYALDTLLGMLDLEPEGLTVFGDDMNDIVMFERAGRAVAVANAVDEVKKRADVIIGSNAEDSVAKYIFEEFMR